MKKLEDWSTEDLKKDLERTLNEINESKGNFNFLAWVFYEIDRELLQKKNAWNKEYEKLYVKAIKGELLK